MPLQTDVTIFARPVGERHGHLTASRAFPGVDAPRPATHVEVVRRTVVTKVRSDGYPDRSVSPTETEEVLLTLGVEAAVDLSGSLTRAVLQALDTRTQAEVKEGRA